jgi:GNAT superfamily N-acetyltransferase
MPDLRPLRDDDVAVAHEIAVAAFAPFDEGRDQQQQPPRTPPDAAHERIRHLMATDPGGCWVAVDGDDAPIGVALALVRERIWGLSLLVVRPDVQSAGAGRALLRAALAHAEGATGGIILGSVDPRALRAYHRAGFTMHPTAVASGTPQAVEPDPAVEPFDFARDAAMAASVDRAVRRAAHGADLEVLAAGGVELLALPGRGYAAHRDGEVKLLAAADEAAARALLRTAIARAGGRAQVSWLTGAQRWAVDVAIDAGLELELWGAVFVRGDVGPFAPYLPSGAYL